MRHAGLVAAVLLAAGAAFAVMKFAGSAQPTAPAPVATPAITSVNVWVAKTAIPVGSVITEEMAAAQPWPEHLVLNGFMRADEGAEPVVGMVARSAFQANEPLIKAKLANPNDPSFLAGDLPKGMRVITIPVTAVDSVAGFVFPGDSVDLLYTHEVESPGDSSFHAGTKKNVTETLLTNVKVLAVDQRASNADSTDEKGKLIVPKTVSLMVTPENAHRIRLAVKTGTISLALRSIEDRESTDTRYVTQGGDISGVSSSDGITVLRGAPKEAMTTVSGDTNPNLGVLPSNLPNANLISVPTTPDTGGAE